MELNAVGDLVVADELRQMQEELERVLAPFTSRDQRDQPNDAAQVRVLACFMPEPGSQGPVSRGV